MTVGFPARSPGPDDAGAGEKDAAPNSDAGGRTAVNAVDRVGVRVSGGDASGAYLQDDHQKCGEKVRDGEKAHSPRRHVNVGEEGRRGDDGRNHLRRMNVHIVS